MPTVTHTKTYNTLDFANPYLRCQVCGVRVSGVLCVDGPWENLPCGHVGIVDTCTSWGPVDECSCQEFLGHVPHEPA